MGSTQRNDNSIAVFASRIANCMEKRRDLTFGQLLFEALAGDEPLTAAINMRRMTDTQLAEALERFVLKGTTHDKETEGRSHRSQDDQGRR